MNWKTKYKEALVEIDPLKLLEIIRETETVMALRSSLPEIQSTSELLEIRDAIQTLNILKTHALADIR